MSYQIFITVVVLANKDILKKLDEICDNLDMTRKVVFAGYKLLEINYQFNTPLTSDVLIPKFDKFCSIVKQELKKLFVSAIMMSGNGSAGGSAISIRWIPKYRNLV